MDNVRNNNVLLVVSIIGIMIITFVRDVMGVMINQYLIVAMISVLLLLLNKQSCINFTFFILPLLCGIQGLTVTVAILIFVFKTKKINALSWFFILIFLILEVINSAGFGTTDSEFPKLLLLYSSNIILFFILLFYHSKDFDSIGPIKYFLIGASYVMFVILYRSILGSGIEGLAFDATRIGGRSVFAEADGLETEFQMNPNSLAFYSLYTMTVLLSFNKQLRFRPLAFYTILFISGLAGILSFSRTWIICIGLFLALSLINKKSNGKELLLAIGASVIVFFIFNVFFDAIYHVFLTRFSEDSVNVAGGRIEIFDSFNRWMFEHRRFIFGIGIIYYQDITNIGHACHSGLQQIYIGYGFIGLALFVLAAILYKKRFISKIRISILLPFIICLLYDQSIQFLSNPILLFPFVMLAYTLRIGVFDASPVDNKG